jgi:hypothetical protein
MERAYLQYLCFDKDGNLYCPSYGYGEIFKITPAGEVSSLQLKDKEGRVFSLQGPNSIFYLNGNLYFTEFTRDALYKVNLK